MVFVVKVWHEAQELSSGFGLGAKVQFDLRGLGLELRLSYI